MTWQTKTENVVLKAYDSDDEEEVKGKITLLLFDYNVYRTIDG